MFFLALCFHLSKADRTSLSKGWRVCRNSTASASQGCTAAPSNWWVSPPLPTTAFFVLLSEKYNASIDPYFATRLHELLPDINDTGPEYYTLRYERSLTVPGILEIGCNYRCEVRVDDDVVESLDEFGGMFARRRYVVGKGLVGIVVSPPDHPGAAVGGQGGDHSLAMDVTSQFVLGWDWMQAMPDRSTGFFGDVTFFTRKEVKDAAILTLGEGRYRAVGEAEGRVEVSIDGEIVGTVEARGDFSFEFIRQNLTLWYPRDFDDCCALHEASFVLDGIESSRFRFGARKFETFRGASGRGFKVNGRPFFVVGGNWIATDAAWRYSANYDRYRDELSLHAEAGLNAVRVWGGGVAEADDFYRVADELGLVVYQEFWMTGDNNGRWAGNYDWPVDRAAFDVAVKSTVRRLRKHASLMLFGGGNELYPQSLQPPRHQAEDLDENVALYIPSSMDGGVQGGNMSLHDDSYALTPKDGPYTMLLPKEFSKRNPGLDPDLKISVQPEVGSCAVPDSLKALEMFADLHNETIWTFHKYENSLDAFVQDYALDDWLFAAKLATHQQSQLLFESYSARLFKWYAAVFYWKTQSPWPALRGFFYDWYLLEPNGNYRGSRAANYRLRRIQYDYGTRALYAVNRHPTRPWTLRNGSMIAEWIDMRGRRLESILIEQDPAAIAAGNDVVAIDPLTSVVLAKNLENRSGLLVVEKSTVYWISNSSDRPDYSFLGRELRNNVSMSLRAKCIDSSLTTQVFVDISVANSSHLLFYPQLFLEFSEKPNSWNPPIFVGGDESAIVRPGTTSRRILSLSPTSATQNADYTNHPRCRQIDSVVLTALNSSPVRIDVKGYELGETVAGRFAD